MEYRKEIDGLRAFAVIPVVFFHAGFELFAGGYVGVDIFFVISGYLITSIILNEIRESTFTIIGFYERRARRILPALFFVMFCCVPFAWVWMAPHQLQDFSQSLVAATLFSSNIFFFLETDYFNELSDRAPLLHTWSLAVEEQYYLLFPPFLLLFWKAGFKVIIGLLILIAFGSFAVAEWLSLTNPVANFYLLPSRIWELLVGVFVAFYLYTNKNSIANLPQFLKEIAGVTGLALILVAIFLFDANTPFPGRWALLPTLGTGLLILCADKGTQVGKFLSIKVFVLFGLISYSLYLWHQPLFAFARITTLGEVNYRVFLILSVLSVLLALFSYRYVERPFRARKKINRKQIFLFATTLMLIFPSLGLWGHLSDGFLDYKLNAIDVAMRQYVIDRDAVLDERREVWNEMLQGSSAPFEIGDSRTKVLILGDSKSQDLFVTIRLNKQLYGQYQYRRARLDDGCMQSLESGDRNFTGGQSCLAEIENLQSSELIDHADVIVLTTTWRIVSNGSVAEFVRYLTDRKKVIVLSTANFNDLTSLSLVIAENRIEGEDLGKFIFQNIRQDQRRAYMELKSSLVDEENLAFLDKLELFCNFETESCELFNEEGEAYIYDTGHLTVLGAESLGQTMARRNWFHNLIE